MNIESYHCSDTMHKYIYIYQHGYIFNISLCTGLLFYVARSTKGITRLSSAERVAITLPYDIKDILVGIMLGDGHIVKRSSTGNSRLVYAQTAIAHKQYFNHVYKIFKPFCVSDYMPQPRVVRDNRTKKTYSATSFTTMQLPCFNVYRDMFYLSNIKKVPDTIQNILTARGLAFWIMDDGSRHGSGLHLNVYAFSNVDVDKLMFTLQDKFKLKCSIHYNRDNKPRIYIFKESMDDLRLLVTPFFHKRNVI